MCAPLHGQPLTGLSGTCVCVHYTAHSHLEPAPVARPVPALAHVLVVPIIRAVTQEGKPLTPGDGAFVWGSSEVWFSSPHFERAVCRPRGQLHPSPKLSSCFPSTEGRSSSCSKTHLPLAPTLPQQTTPASLNSLRLTRKTNPKVLSEFSACGAS